MSSVQYSIFANTKARQQCIW